MKVKLIYGAPCSGKTTYVRDNSKDADFIFDYDRVLTATTNRELHLAEKHILHFCILELRKKFVEVAKNESKIETFWVICSRITESIEELFRDMDTEKIFIEATKEECYDRLDKDKSRPDKEEWRKIIDEWFDKSANENRQVENFQNTVKKLRMCMAKANLKISHPKMKVLENRLEKFQSINKGKSSLMIGAEELDNWECRISARDLLKQIGVELNV